MTNKLLAGLCFALLACSNAVAPLGVKDVGPRASTDAEVLRDGAISTDAMIDSGAPIDAAVFDAAQIADSGSQTTDAGLADDARSQTDSGGGAIPGPRAAQIEGETDCGHDHPIWIWTFRDPVDEIRFRVDAQAWIMGTAQTGRHQASGLSEGVHHFEIQGRTATSLWSDPARFETVITVHRSNAGYWQGVARSFTRSPLGHVVAVACHNCYDDGAGNRTDNLTNTESILDDAVRDGADLLELDVKLEQGHWHVDHNDDGGTSGAFLEDVLALIDLKSADAPLFIEIKETAPTFRDISNLIEMLVDEGYAVNGRPVVLRTFLSRIDNLRHAQMALDDYPFHAPYFRLHVLYGRNDASSVENFQNLIQDAYDDDYQGIELNLTTDNLFALFHKAEALDMGVAVWTVPVSMGEIYCTGLREEVDVLITDYPIDECVQLAQEDTQILYLDVSQQAIAGNSVNYIYDGTNSGTIALSGSGKPDLRSSPGGVLTGSYLDFNASTGDNLGFHDGDNDPGEGYFVVAVYKPDLLQGNGFDTQAIVSKADSGGFALEIDREPSRVLRYGVRVGGGYEYATQSTSYQSRSQLHFVIGAFDGNGKVRLWLDASDNGVTESAVLSNGVQQNDVPIRIGADPQGTTATRFYFDGAIQMISIHKWSNH